MVSEARAALDSQKGAEIVALDVRGLTAVTDVVLLCTGNSAPHLKALAAEVVKHLKTCGAKPYRQSGDALSGWIVLDFVDIVIHILARERREYYALEALWETAPRLA